jgi:hypothetical protein
VRVITGVVIRRPADDLASATPNRYRLLARHPDGAVFEYVSRQREPR